MVIGAQSLQKLKIKFVAKLGVMGKYERDGVEKFHVIVPRQFIDDVKGLKGKQVKITIEDEI
jgi:hypothetical protein